MNAKQFKKAMRNIKMPSHAAMEKMPKRWGRAGTVNKKTLVQQPTRFEYVAAYIEFCREHSEYYL